MLMLEENGMKIRYGFVLLCCVAVVVVMADGTPTGIQWPNWRIATSEYPDAPGYPITNMVDGSPETAWVYHKPWQDTAGTASALTPDEIAERVKDYKHGVGVTVTISTDQWPYLVPFSADGIGLINGYAKSASTYWRNNRITKLHVYASGASTHVQKTVTLAESREIQRIPLPAGKWQYIELRVESVNAGVDDDLCISELALYRHSRPLSWQLTSTVLYNPGNDCGCGGGPHYVLMTPREQIIQHQGKPCEHFNGVLPRAGTSRVLLCTEDTAYVYDFASGRFLAMQTVGGQIQQLGWSDARHAYVSTLLRNDRTAIYRFTASPPTWTKLPATATLPRLQNGGHQPNYGA